MSWFKTATPKKMGGGVEIVTFADGTDEQIEAMLDAYYAGDLTWEDMGWAVGDTRLIHLDAMACPNPNSSSTLAAQDITVVIIGHDHTDLATPINGVNKACITVQTKECIGPCDSNNGIDGTIYVKGNNAKDTTFAKWSNLYMRTYLNSTVWGAMPNTFKSAIKESKHNRHTTYNGTASEEVTDNLFLPSYPEICGTETYNYYQPTNPTEGTQFEYYASNDTTCKIKYGNNNGVSNGIAQYWWEGSPCTTYSSNYGYYWCRIEYYGSGGAAAGMHASALSPAWAM